MTELGTWRRITGQASLLLFAVMAVILAWWIAPRTGGETLPQVSFAPYTDASLAELALTLGKDHYPTYRALLVYADTAFLLTFAAFTALMLRLAWPRLGTLLGFAYALTDFTENRLILRQSDQPFAPGGWQPALPIDASPSPAWYFTLAKFALFALCLAAIAAAAIKER